MNLFATREEVMTLQFIQGARTGHYESYFIRANHPSRPLAFWIRYTIFSPRNKPERAIGELWAIFFNGETQSQFALKNEVPLARCNLTPDPLAIRIGEAVLIPGLAQGSITAQNSTISWELTYTGYETPLLDFPLQYYYSRFPRAKVLVSLPLATFRGEIRINDESIRIDNWIGSENHNWGSQHTDHYAWGQVAGFDSHPDTFLELATARVRIGCFWTPFITVAVLRHKGVEYELNRLASGFNRGRFSYFTWQFTAEAPTLRIEGAITADKRDFVCLRYLNPPGGMKYCLNTKLAACQIKLIDRNSNQTEFIETQNRSAFEILTGQDDHGFEVRC